MVLITTCGLPSDAWLRSVSNTRKNFSASMTVNLADLRSPDCIESDLSQSKHSHQLAANEFAWQSYVSVDFHIAVSTAFYRGGSPGSFVGTTVRRYVRSFEASKPQLGVHTGQRYSLGAPVRDESSIPRKPVSHAGQVTSPTFMAVMMRWFHRECQPP